jgi:phospholipid/cholesterol/gamma-HCH transport system substrate-binding protein
MKEKTRNLIVGLTVAGALAILAGMIVLFRQLPSFLRGGYPLVLQFSDTGGVGAGSSVELKGKNIGRVGTVAFTGGDAHKGVTIVAYIDSDVNIPGTVNAYIYSALLGGLGGSKPISLNLDDQLPGAQRAGPGGKPLEFLPRDGSIVLEGKLVSAGNDLLAPELVAQIRDAMASFRRLAETLNAFMVAPPGPAAPVTTQDGGATAPAVALTATSAPRAISLQETLAKLGATLDSINSVLGDVQTQQNVKETMAKLNTAAGLASDALKDMRTTMVYARDKIDQATTQTSDLFSSGTQLVHSLIEDANRLGNVLKSLEKASNNLDTAEGSLGKLINDPALYRQLLEAVTQMKQTLTSLQQLTEDWKRNGLKVKL